MMGREERSLLRFFGIALTVLLVALTATVYACNRGMASWCANQYKVATTHADTVSAARLCGAP